MGIISSMRRQAAVYWAPAAPDQFGRVDVESPIDIACRWEDVAETFIGASGATATSRAKVYVDRDVVPGGWLYLGEVADLVDSTAHPRTIEDAYQIEQFNKLPTLKATDFLRTAML